MCPFGSGSMLYIIARATAHITPHITFAPVLNVVRYSTNSEHCQTPRPCLGWRLAPAGVVIALEASAAARRLHDVVQRCWSQSPPAPRPAQ